MERLASENGGCDKVSSTGRVGELVTKSIFRSLSLSLSFSLINWRWLAAQYRANVHEIALNAASLNSSITKRENKTIAACHRNAAFRILNLCCCRFCFAFSLLPTSFILCDICTYLFIYNASFATRYKSIDLHGRQACFITVGKSAIFFFSF